MNVWENVAFGPSIKNWEKQKVNIITSEILEMVRLSDRKDAFPTELSGGMQQRVALARGIASGARILLLDEPLGALDARLRVDLRRQLKKLVKDQNLTTIHVTHDQEEALMTADRIVLLRKGKVKQVGSPSELYSTPNSIFTANFVGGANFLEGIITNVDSSGSTVKVRDGSQIDVIPRNRKIGEKVVVAMRLEDVSIDEASPSGLNSLAGKIESATFIGGSMKYEISLGHDVTLSSETLISKVHQPFKRGDDVTISFPPERCYLFPYPTAGLLKEIEAI
jgi:ABC-type Fe3+/spermidine/putrescine transport system ATPase subunit